MKKYILLLLIAFLSVHLLAQDKNQFNPVNTGVNSLGIAPDSRGGGMGDVGAATDPDVNSQYWNPAKYPFTISRAGVAVSYTPWLRKLVNDIDLAYLAGYYRIGDYQAVSGSLRYFSLGEVPVAYQDENSPGYTIKPYEMAVDVAYSRMLSEHFSAAVALRYIYSDLAYREDEEVSAGSAFAADIAFYYTNYVILAQRECMLSFGLNASKILRCTGTYFIQWSDFRRIPRRWRFLLPQPAGKHGTASTAALVRLCLLPVQHMPFHPVPAGVYLRSEG